MAGRAVGPSDGLPDAWAVSSGLAETLSPIAQGYGAGQMAGDAYQAAKAGDYGAAAGGGLMAAMSMMPMKKGAIEIMRKYGILAPMAGGVGAGAMTQQQQPGILGQ